jgi:hypothetical protein
VDEGVRRSVGEKGRLEIGMSEMDLRIEKKRIEMLGGWEVSEMKNWNGNDRRK